MKLDRAFQLSTLLLTGIAFAGLALTTQLPLGFQLLGYAGLSLSWLSLRRDPISHEVASPWFGTMFWNVLILVAFAWFWVDVLWLSHDLLESGVHFLIALMVNKLFNLQLRRDYLQLYAISLMMVLASAGMTTDLWYGAFVIAYLLAGVWTLLLYQLYMEQVSATSAHGDDHIDAPPLQSIDGPFFWTTNGFALLALSLTLLIFFSIPRIGAGFFHRTHGEAVRTAGFSEQVDLGAIGAIKLDDSIVMRVELQGGHAPSNGPLYLRGVAYDTYNGRAWTNTAQRLRFTGNEGTNHYRLPTGRNRPLTPPQAQDILLEPLDTTVLFGASMPRALEGDFQSLHVDAMGGLYLPFPAQGRTQYRVWSSPLQIREQDRVSVSDQSDAYAEPALRHFLQLPALNPAIATLARERTAQAQTPYAKVTALYQFLQADFRYSLDLGRTASDQPLYDFLFTRKTGYCEHYATALVVLLRSIGVPARLVTGFLPTEWNDYGNYYTVRQRDAHAWVEVYYPHSGWVTVDPTPNVSPAMARGWWQTWSSLLDSLHLQWDRVIVQYSATDQMAVVQSVRRGTDSLRSGLAETWQAWTRLLTARLSSLFGPLPGNVLTWLFVVLILALAAVVGWRASRRGSARRKHSTGPQSIRPDEAAAQRLYGQVLSHLSKRGFHKPTSQTANEFLQSVAQTWRDAEPTLRALTDLYQQVRFGYQPYTDSDLREADRLLTRLRALPSQAAITPPTA